MLGLLAGPRAARAAALHADKTPRPPALLPPPQVCTIANFLSETGKYGIKGLTEVNTDCALRASQNTFSVAWPAAFGGRVAALKVPPPRPAAARKVDAEGLPLKVFPGPIAELS